MAIVTIASLNDISIGDKTVGRHGNKGVIARIVPRENMPFMENGDIPDIILSPLSPIARGNVGQLCECLVGMAGYKMGKRIVVPTLSSEDNYAMTQRLEAVLRDEYGFGEPISFLPLTSPFIVRASITQPSYLLSSVTLAFSLLLLPSSLVSYLVLHITT